MISLSTDQSDAIAAAVKNSQNGAYRALDPADPADSSAIGAFLALMGKTPETHPGLHGDLKQLSSGKGACADGGDQVLQIVDQGRDSNGRATARVWHLDRAGTFASGSLALALDGETGEPLALGYANKVGGGLCPAATRSSTAQPAGKTLTTVGFFHAQSHPEAMPAFGMVSQTSEVAATDTMVDATVTAPVSATNAVVNIGLGRGQNPNTDVDYSYGQDTAAQPPLMVPFTGTVNVQQPLANVDPNGHFTTGLSLTTKLWSKSGNSYSLHNGSQSINSQVTGNTSTNVVSWSYPYDANNTDPNSQNPPQPSLVYAALDAANSGITAFYFEFLIPVATPQGTFQFNVCSYDWPEQPSVNCYQIKDLQFWWHCLAEGTLITLADGSTLPIEKVDNRKRVRTGQGGDLGVEATTRGLHTVSQPNDPTRRVYSLSTRRGCKLVLTGGHPVVTPDGLVAACELAAGMEVVSEDGIDRVTEIAPVESSAVFCNLKLIDESDRARGLGGTVGTFFANGVAVGDFASLQQLHYNNTHSLDYMLARIPERHHVDYASTLAAIHRDNVRYGGDF